MLSCLHIRLVTPLPAYSYNFVVIGHGPETVGFSTVWDEVSRFYDDATPDAYRVDIIHKYDVDYIVSWRK